MMIAFCDNLETYWDRPCKYYAGCTVHKVQNNTHLLSAACNISNFCLRKTSLKNTNQYQSQAGRKYPITIGDCGKLNAGTDSLWKIERGDRLVRDESNKFIE